MISEGSCDTEDWRNGCGKFSIAITGINCILKYIKIETDIFNFVIILYNITVFVQMNAALESISF